MRHPEKRNAKKFINLETFSVFEKKLKYFETRFLEEVDTFLSKLQAKSVAKILYNIDIAEQTNDPKLFKKLQNDIWEFRTKFGGIQIRLLAFWDKTDANETLVLATHGFVKKVDKVSDNKIERAKAKRIKYFENRPKI